MITENAPDPAEDGIEVELLRKIHNRADEYYTNAIKNARLFKSLEDVGILGVERDFCREVNQTLRRLYETSANGTEQ